MGKRNAIIDASILLFKEKGIEQTKISDIVADAKIAQGTFYLYFPSKLSLMPAIADKMVKLTMKTVQNKVEQEQTIEEKLEIMINSIFSINE